MGAGVGAADVAVGGAGGGGGTLTDSCCASGFGSVGTAFTCVDCGFVCTGAAFVVCGCGFDSEAMGFVVRGFGSGEVVFCGAGVAGAVFWGTGGGGEDCFAVSGFAGATTDVAMTGAVGGSVLTSSVF